MKATCILVVDRVEPTRDFFVDRLGFEVVTEVPMGDQTGFSLLKAGEAELMVQSFESVAGDLSVLGGERFRTIVYVDVPDASALQEQFAPADVAVPLRTTFYGTHELFVREPGGNVVGLASPVPA